ncbi:MULTISPECIES: hypothetical protein [Vibrio]|jgi:phosphogluconate dehydratase|uniref:hypothetical protein n=1 Tax=Vibrio TaxID=662 RepID=UPI000EF1149C|nr:hypothetical protein [Vibrio sp. PID23_8]RIZ54968.1 hypothetical protein AK966_06320 [Vibrio sp. PID23_8]
MTINTVIAEVAHNIVPRSKTCRKTYLYNIERSASKGKMRATLACGNLAHTVAAATEREKRSILDFTKSNLAIVTSYNDMVSAH